MSQLHYLPPIILSLVLAASTASAPLNNTPVKRKTPQQKLSYITPTTPPTTNKQVIPQPEQIIFQEIRPLITTPFTPLTEQQPKPLTSNVAQTESNERNKEHSRYLNYNQSQQLADSIAEFVAKRIHPTTLQVISSRRDDHSSLTIALNDSLKKAGFELTRSKAPESVVLKYQVSPLNNGYWVQIQLNQTEANRYYLLDTANNLVATAPFSIREDR